MATKTKPKIGMVANDPRVRHHSRAQAPPIEYQRRIVRDRHTGKLAEIDLHELPARRRGRRGQVLRVQERTKRYPPTTRPSSTHPDASARPTTERR